MVKKIPLLVILLIVNNVVTAQKLLRGTVRNEKGEPIDACAITLLPTGASVYTNKNGAFSISCNTQTQQRLMVYHMGYRQKEVDITNDTLHIVLQYKVNELKETTIGASVTGLIKKHAIMGNNNLKPFGECYGSFGSEKAIFLRADSSQHGLLENVCFHIADDGQPTTRYRIHVYEIDTNYLPGTDLLDSVVTAQASHGNEWVCTNLSRYQIAVGRGLFVAMEWVSGYGNKETPVPSHKHRYEPNVYGQVLSLTEGYRKQGSLLYQRRNSGPWHYLVAGGTNKRNLLNPAVYATYTYLK